MALDLEWNQKPCRVLCVVKLIQLQDVDIRWLDVET
jgi:hypothetical protein